jgi:subtilisin family serine protease
MKSLVMLATVVVFSAGSLMAAPGKLRRVAEPVADQYIVVLKDRNANAVIGIAMSMAATYGGSLRYVYDTALIGFSIEMTEDAAKMMSQDPRVLFVEENGIERTGEPSAADWVGNDPGLWHLDRLDERWYDQNGNLDGYYRYCQTGAGVLAYVVDTGINAAHPEFKPGQVKAGADFIQEPNNFASNPCINQSSGWHGTAVAAILGGQISGVAKDVTLVPVRALTCDPFAYTDRFLAALNWIISPNPSTFGGFAMIPVNPDREVRPAVVNISFWVPRVIDDLNQYSHGHLGSIELAVHDLINSGLTVVTSANNFSDNACSRAPANVSRGNQGWGLDSNGNWVLVDGRVISVGGTMRGVDGLGGKDFRWQNYVNGMPATGQDSGSSYGSCVSIWAPAMGLRVAHHQGGTFTSSGTSYSAPQVAGVVARYLQGHLTSSNNYSVAMPDQVWTWLLSQATTTDDDFVSDIVNDAMPGSPQRLLHWYQICRVRPAGAEE